MRHLLLDFQSSTADFCSFQMQPHHKSDFLFTLTAPPNHCFLNVTTGLTTYSYSPLCCGYLLLQVNYHPKSDTSITCDPGAEFFISKLWYWLRELFPAPLLNEVKFFIKMMVVCLDYFATFRKYNYHSTAPQAYFSLWHVP